MTTCARGPGHGGPCATPEAMREVLVRHVCPRAAAPVVQHRARPDRAEAGPGPRVPGPPSRTARRGGRLTRWSLVGSRHPGRLAQRERVSLTRRRSQVQILYRPPPPQALAHPAGAFVVRVGLRDVAARCGPFVPGRKARRRWAVSYLRSKPQNGSQRHQPPGLSPTHSECSCSWARDPPGQARHARRKAARQCRQASVGTAPACCAPDVHAARSDQPLNLVYGPGGGVKMAWIPMRRQTT